MNEVIRTVCAGGCELADCIAMFVHEGKALPTNELVLEPTVFDHEVRRLFEKY